MQRDFRTTIALSAHEATGTVELTGMMCAAESRPVHMEIGSLIDQLVSARRDILGRLVPRTRSLVIDAVAANAALPGLSRLKELFPAFASDLELQWSQEEQLLFPMIRRLQATSKISGCHAGMVKSRIRFSQQQQGDLLGALAAMHDLAALYLSPNGPCEICHELLSALDTLQAAFCEHLRLEQDLLFPQAAALEAELCSRG